MESIHRTEYEVTQCGNEHQHYYFRDDNKFRREKLNTTGLQHFQLE